MDDFIPLFITFLKKRRNETENFNPVSENFNERNLNYEDSITEITTKTTTKNYEEEAKAPAPKFHLFEEYKKITGKTPNGIQSPHLIRWVSTFPAEVLQEALNRLQERAPDNPFNYLKSILEDWQAKKLLTLEAVLQQDKKQESPKKRKSVDDDTGGSGAMINGHFVDF